MMNPEVKAKWVAALRSGEYTQTKYILQDRDGDNCCLGVLCKVLGFEPVIGKDSTPFFLLRDDTKPSSAYVPEGFKGLTSEAIETLTDMNDVQDKSFNEIADYIESEL